MAFYVYLLTISCLLFVIPAKAGDDDETMAACKTLFNPERMKEHCCETANAIGGDKHGGDCIKKGEGYNCDVAKCMFEAEGLADGDDVNEPKVIELLDEIYKKNEDAKGITTSIKNSCMDKKYLDYPPKDSCPFIQMQICMWTHTMTSCPKWKDTDSCKELAKNAEICRKAMESKK